MKIQVRDMRKIGMLAAWMLAAAFLLCALYPVLESAHDCPGDECPVCAQIGIVQILSKLTAFQSAGFAFALCFAQSVRPGMLLLDRFVLRDTPVTMKVKFSD